jgi:hypothetical protein
MAMKMTTAEFVSRASLIHNNKYDYSLVDYKNTNHPVDIVCKVHGVFSQLPKIHLKGCDCQHCALALHPNHQPLTQREFIQKAIVKHKNKYKYSAVVYVNNATKVNIECDCGNIFSIRPSAHLSGQGCYKCGKIKTGMDIRLSAEEFINRIKSIHGDNMQYDKISYTTMTNPVTAECIKHGEFTLKRAAYLLDNKFSCPQCVVELKRVPAHTDGPGIYHINRTTLDTTKTAMVYIIKLSNMNEEFYKVGVTINDVKKRFSSKMVIAGYDIHIIQTTVMTLGEAIIREHHIINEHAHHKYVPMNKFSGHTECLSICPNIAS